MNIACGICSPCDELIPPYLNLSAELPDQYLFWSTYYGNPQNPPPLDSFPPPGPGPCPGVAFGDSSTSQQIADANSANNIITQCDPINPVTNHPYTIYYNTFQIFSANCPGGQPYSFSVAAGTYAAQSVAQANAIALSFCKQFANTNRHCPPNDSVCPNVPLPNNFDVYIVKEILLGPANFTFKIVSGSLPPGVSLTKTSATSAQLTGTPTQIGNYSWTVRAQYQGYSIDYPSSMGVLGITNLPFSSPGVVQLPGAVAGQAYSYQLQFTGNLHTVTVAIDVDIGNPPFWMTVSAGGLITGTPDSTSVGTFNFDFELTDS